MRHSHTPPTSPHHQVNMEILEAQPFLLNTRPPSRSSNVPVSGLRGYIFLTLSAVSQSAMTLCTREAAQNGCTTGTLLLFRGLTCITILTIVILRSKPPLYSNVSFAPSDIFSLCIRAFITALSLYFLFDSLSSLPAGTALSLFYTAPVWIIILVNVKTNSPFKAFHVVTIIFKGVGAILVFYAFNITPVLEVMFAAFLSAISFTLLATRPLHIPSTFYMLGVGIATLIGSALDRGTSLASTPAVASLAAFGGACTGVASQLFLVKGMPLVATAPGVIIRSVACPLTFFCAMVFFGEQVSRESVAGVCLILTAVAIVAYNVGSDFRLLNECTWPFPIIIMEMAGGLSKTSSLPSGSVYSATV